MRSGSLLGRMAAVLLLLGAAWSVWSIVEAPALASVARDRLTIAQATALLHEEQGGADRAAAAKAQRASMRRFIEQASWSLDRSSPELLVAQLQRSVESTASGAGSVVASSRSVPAQSVGGLTRVGLGFELQSTLPSLQALLLRIEAARPRIFVDRLTVQVPEGGGSSKGADGQSELGVALHVSIYASHRPPATAL